MGNQSSVESDLQDDEYGIKTSESGPNTSQTITIDWNTYSDDGQSRAELSDLTAGIPPRDCHDIYKRGFRVSGVYQIKPREAKTWEPVYCEMFNGSGWMVFQRRQDGSQDFKRRWLEYKYGFGNLYGEFWLGNEHLYRVTSQRQYVLRVDMWTWEGQRAYAQYSEFQVEGEKTDYLLHVSGFTGDAGDSLSHHSGMKFSAEDKDNDLHARNCAADDKGGWWFNSCYTSNLNGLYHTSWYSRGGPTFADGIVWYTLKESEMYSLKRVEMKIRPLRP